MPELLLQWLFWPAVGFGMFMGALLVLFLLNGLTRVFVYIRNDEYGVVEKLWSVKGSVKTGFMSLNGSAGFLPDVIRGGPHLFPPFQYRVHRQPLITVRSMGYVFARDGVPLPAGQTLAKTPDGVFFDNARGFLEGGGQRGPQRNIIREGVYAINTALFVVMTSDGIKAHDIGQDENTLQEVWTVIQQRNGFEPVVIRDKDDLIGVVTVHDGPVLDHGSIIAPAVGTDKTNETMFHNSFQDIEKFIVAGGCRGRQEQVLVEGTYFLHRLFATVELKPKTTIDIGFVGVVVSYSGLSGVDVSGADYRHGSLVAKGERGVWAVPLSPGKYPFNPFAFKVIPVPTTNFVLKWIEGKKGDHGLDANLAEIKLITKDAFEPILPLSIVVHISPENAPKLIQQFADVQRLVDQTIDPMVAAWAKDEAQKLTMLDLINERGELQERAKEVMQLRFSPYNIEVTEVLIGTPRAAEGDTRIKALLDQIRDRQLALEQQTTYVSQSAAASEQQKLKKAQAAADQQTALTESEIQITVRENQGKAELKTREQQAAGTKVTADADAYRVEKQGQAQAKQIEAVGLAEGAAIKAQVEAFSGPGAELKLRATIAEMLGNTIQHATMPLVPSVMINGGGEEGSSDTMVKAMLAMMLSNQARDKVQ